MRANTYLNNLAENIIGQTHLRALMQCAHHYVSFDYLWTTVKLSIEQGVSAFSSEKLGFVIGQAQLSPWTISPNGQRQQFPISNSQTWTDYLMNGLNTGGKAALIPLASLAVAVAIHEMILQAYEERNGFASLITGEFEKELFDYITRWINCPLAGRSNRHQVCTPTHMRRLGFRVFAITDSWGKTDIFFDKYIWKPSVATAARCPSSVNIRVISGTQFDPIVDECNVDTMRIVQRHLSGIHDAAVWNDGATMTVNKLNAIELLKA